MDWYRIVGFVERETMQVRDARTSFSKIYAYPYIGASFVKPYDNELTVRHLIEQMLAMPYGKAYSALDTSQELQRKMAEQKTIRLIYTTSGNIPVYAEPSTTSRITGNYRSNTDFYDLVVVDSKPDWKYVIDFHARVPSGWVEASKLNVAEY
jgi:hypothetical protein